MPCSTASRPTIVSRSFFSPILIRLGASSATVWQLCMELHRLHPHPLCVKVGAYRLDLGRAMWLEPAHGPDATVVTCQLSASGKVLDGKGRAGGSPDPRTGSVALPISDVVSFPAFATATCAGPASLDIIKIKTLGITYRGGTRTNEERWPCFSRRILRAVPRCDLCTYPNGPAPPFYFTKNEPSPWE